MNPQENPSVPGYLVEAFDPSDKSRRNSRTFQLPNLLSARLAAFQYAQDLQAKPLRNHVLEITISLIEIERTVIPNRQEILFTVFSQQFQPNFRTPQGRTKRIAITVDADSSLTESVDVTIDPAQNDEAFNSPKAIWNSLGELTCEREYYYEYGYDPGFGYVLINLEGPHIRLPEVSDLSTLSDEEIRERIDKLRQPKPYSSFYLIQDALPYAISLIGNYNEHYANEAGKLSFTTKFLSPQQA
ncbi:hypothetical protein [Spirosoma aerolatum]|uniref:hypothetical protein n=1 Tax=Spirosoma aerolatum TaxID=1211326 RepID=UPI0009ADFDBC|nr:hypothetical protein [Spirosoma aerolatum]